MVFASVSLSLFAKSPSLILLDLFLRSASESVDKMPVIEKKLLKNLTKYKYSAVDLSPLSRYVLQPYWTKLVTFFPLWGES